MPKIREYSQQVDVAGPVQTPQLRGSDISAAGGLSSIGKGLSDVSDYIEQREEFEARKDMVREQLDTRKEIADMEKKAPPGADGFDEQVNAVLEKRKEKMQEKYSSGRASRFVSQSLDDFQSSVKLGAYEFKAKSQGLRDVTDVKDIKTELQNDTRANPDMLDKNIAAQAQLIEKMRVGQNDKYRFHKESLPELYDAALDGQVSKMATSEKTTIKEVDAMIAQVSNKDGKWALNNSKPVYDAQLSKLEQLKESLLKKNKDDELNDLKEAHAQLAKTGDYNQRAKGLYGPEWIEKSNLTPREKKAALTSYKMSEAEGQANTFFAKGGNVTQAMDKIKALKEDLDKTPEFFKDNTALVSMQKVTADIIERAQKDPAGLTAEYDPIVKANLDVAMREGTPEAFSRYATLALNKQEQFFPGGPKGLFPKEMKDRTKAVMDAAASGGNFPQAATEHLQGIQQLTGKHYTQVLGELVADKAISREQSVAGFFAQDPKNAKLATNMFMAQMKTKSDIDQLASPGDIKEINDSLRTRLLPLQRVLSRSIGDKQASDVMNTYMETFMKTAVVTAPNGSGSAVNTAKNLADMVLGSMTIKDTYYIPNTQKNPGYISEGIEAFRRSLNESVLSEQSLRDSSGRSAPEIHKSVAARIKQYGQPVTLSDNSGLEFLDENGGKVFYKKDGVDAPAVFKWDELEKMGMGSVTERGKTPVGRKSSNPFRMD